MRVPILQWLTGRFLKMEHLTGRRRHAWTKKRMHDFDEYHALIIVFLLVHDEGQGSLSVKTSVGV